MNPHIRKLIIQAQNEIAQLPCGGIDALEGPNLAEMDAYVAEHYQPYEGNADYHAGRYAWLLLQDALRLIAQEDGE